MKKINFVTKMMAILMIAGVALSACEQSTEAAVNEYVSIISVGDEGETDLSLEALKVVYGIGDGDLTTAQEDWLKFMREEEKLAQDVYMTLSEIYTVPVFKNISKAETNHASVVLAYLNAWNIDDPASSETGVFINQELQDLFNELVEKGQESLQEALKVGALIEEVDILDLAKVDELNPGDEIKALADALTLGSRNHLRAFTRILKFQDVIYEPALLSIEDYEAIVNSPWERGNGFCIDIKGGTDL